jgi:hypothetical protein
VTCAYGIDSSGFSASLKIGHFPPLKEACERHPPSSFPLFKFEFDDDSKRVMA